MIQFPAEIIEMYKDFKPMYKKVYRIIYDSLFLGKINMDEKFTEEEIAHALGISRTPVRAALDRLRSEGVFVNIPHNNLGIKEYTKKEKLDLLLLDELLEGKAAYLAAQREISEEDLSSLMELNEAIASYTLMDDSVASNSAYGVRDLHFQFHLMIAKLSGNRFLYKKIVELRTIMRMHKSDIPYRTDNRNNYPRRIAPMHERLIEALRTGNPEEAELFIRCDISEVKAAYWDSQIDVNYSKQLHIL